MLQRQAAVTAFGTLPGDVPHTLSIFALAPAFSLLAWPFAGTQSTGREPLVRYLRDVVWVAGPLLTGVLYAVV